MNRVTDVDVFKILNNLYRRKGLIVSVFVVVSLLAYIWRYPARNLSVKHAHCCYAQRIPTRFWSPDGHHRPQRTMQSIVQEILSRTRLEKIIKEFDLYPSQTNGSIEERIERLRRKVKIELRRNNVFELSFESENPEKQNRYRRLSSLFIEQNLQAREQQAEGTKSFINAEAERLRKGIGRAEAVVNRYKAVTVMST